MNAFRDICAGLVGAMSVVVGLLGCLAAIGMIRSIYPGDLSAAFLVMILAGSLVVQLFLTFAVLAIVPPSTGLQKWIRAVTVSALILTCLAGAGAWAYHRANPMPPYVGP